MRTRTGRFTKLSMLGGAAAAVLALGVACSLQSPDNVTGPRPSAPKAKMIGQNDVYFEFQVEKPVSPTPGNPTPRYPDALRAANIEGEVLVQFVTSETGVVDMSTFKVLKSTDSLFTQTVRRALPNMKFSPAEVGGRGVKQLVQMPFTFSLSKGTATATRSPSKDTSTVRRLSEVTVTAAKRPEGAPVRAQPPRDEAAETAKLRAGLVEVPVGEARKVIPNESRNPNQTYFEFQVRKGAAPLVGNPTPRYPDAMRAANIPGEVLAQFVVGNDGRVDMSTFKVLKTTDPLFAKAVESALPNMKFSPAEVGGVAVRQLIQMPFQFNLSKE